MSNDSDDDLFVSCDPEEDRLDFVIQNGLKDILTVGEKKQEAFLEKIFIRMLERVESDANNDGGRAYYELQKAKIIEIIERKFSENSFLLGEKFGKLCKNYITRYFESKLSKCLSRINVNAPNLVDMVEKYAECFVGWVRSKHVNFTTNNGDLLGNIPPRECFILTFFSCLTNIRVEGDNCYALSVVGKSSSGKTKLFENPLGENGFTHVAEGSACNRYDVGKKNVYCYHDIQLDAIAKPGPKMEMFKALCRTEKTTVKAFAAVTDLPPLWVFVTSNQRILDHDFSPNMKKRKETFGGMYKYPHPSQLPDYRDQERREKNAENIQAVKNRVLEAFVKERTGIDLPKHGKFTRMQAVLGLYSIIIAILENRLEPTDFASPILISYCLTALVNNFKCYKRVFASHYGIEEKVFKQVYNLIIKYNVENETERNEYLRRLFKNYGKNVPISLDDGDGGGPPKRIKLEEDQDEITKEV